MRTKEGTENISDMEKSRMIKKWKEIGIDLPEDEWRSAPALYQYYKVLLNSNKLISLIKDICK